MIRLLNLDGSYPAADAFHATNALGQIRFISEADALTLPAFQRVQGDIVKKFNLHQEKINEVIQAIAGNPSLSGWDDSAYVRVDGSRAFSNPIFGQRPTEPSHLATKDYVDGQDLNLSTSITQLSESIGSLKGVRSISSIWVYEEWRAGQKVILTLPLAEEIASDLTLLSINVIEGIDVATSGPEKFLYRPVNQVTGAKVDDIWLDGSSVKVALPNNALYPSGYPSEYQSTVSPRARKYKATVLLQV